MSLSNEEKNKSKLGYELLSNFKFYSNYSKYDEVKGKYESWNDSVDRVFDQMHGIKFKDQLENNPKFKEYYDYAKQKYLEKYVLASQRSLQFGGEPILKHNSKMFNCLTLYCDRPRFFQDTMYWLLSGCGVGFSVQNPHISKLPKIKKRSNRSKVHIVEDSIEGWADAIGVLMSSYFEGDVPFTKYQNCHVSFDYSEVRPKGAKISGGFKAPGSEGLRNGIQKIEELIEKELDKPNFDGILESIVAYDIVMFMADATLSGGVRRCISKGSRVLTKNNSFKNIENIKIGDLVSTDGGWKEVTNIFDQGIQNAIKIKHQDGYLICTPNHRVAVLIDGNGNFIWKNAEDLKNGDKLFFVNNENDNNFINKLPEFNYNKPLNSTTCKDIIIPQLDEEIAWLIGVVHGDGYVRLTSGSGEVSIACEGTNPEKASYIDSLIKRFGVNTTIIYPKENDNCYKIHAKSKQLGDYFYNNIKQPKTIIKVPEFIKSASNNIKISYIQGVLDADGCVLNRPQNILVSVYESFVQDIQSLCYSMGIVTRINKLSSKNEKWQQQYTLVLVNNDDKIKFNELSRIGWKKFTTTRQNKHSNSFPLEFFKEKVKKENLKYADYGKLVSTGNESIPISTWNKIFKKNNIVPINVVSVENYGDINTYDIEVKDNHSFICEGILVHNSATICLFSVDDEKMLKAKTGKWFIENPQRARSNNSVLLNRNTITKEEFHSIFQSVKQFGEPGFGFAENEDIIYNPCLSKDSNILTNQGWFKIFDLIGKKFTAVVFGNEYDSNDDGFFKTGTKQLYKLTTKNGISVKSTDNHMFFVCKKESNNIDDYNWTELKHISINDYILLDSENISDIKYDIVTEINEDIIDEVYDASIENVNCFNVNGCITHNCFEIGMRPKTESGVSGSQGCNLVEINGGKCLTEKEFYDACKAASIIGTMQATYTDFKYVEPATKEIFERESLLGVSITGFMTNPDILLNPEIQRKGARIVKKINKEVAEMLGIRQAARTTCVKPSGNASTMLSTSSGIHGEHSEHYIRNVQANKEDDIAKYFYENNPKMVENSVWSANNTDWVISFPIIANKDSIFKDQLHGIKLLEYVKLTQQNWVEEGTNVELCTDPAIRHNVSNTIVVDDWEEVENYIFENRKYFAGVSLLPMTGDKDYNQAPFTSILMPEQLLKKYGESVFFVSGLIVDGLNSFNNNLWLACDTVLGNGEKLEYTEKEVEEKIKFSTPRELWEKLGFKNGTLDKLSSLYIKPEVEEYKRYMDSKLNSNVHNYVLKKDWVRRAKQFAERYFSSDKEMVYCLKDVHNYHKWVEITREINDIDWDNLSIKPKYTDIDTLGAIACSGGACEV